MHGDLRAFPEFENLICVRNPETDFTTMNTVKSVWLGWGTLMVAGAGAYYFAKRDINAYRREQELKGARGTEYLECIHLPLSCYFPFPGACCAVKRTTITTHAPCTAGLFENDGGR